MSHHFELYVDPIRIPGLAQGKTTVSNSDGVSHAAIVRQVIAADQMI